MKIEWAEPAVNDLESIRDYIQRNSKHYADKFVQSIVESVKRLEKFPQIGPRIPEVKTDEIRELIYHNYRTLYKIEKKRIVVLAVIQGHRS